MQCTKCRQPMRDMGTTPATLNKTFYCSDCQAYRQRLPLKSAASDLTQVMTHKNAAGKFYLRDEFTVFVVDVTYTQSRLM